MTTSALAFDAVADRYDAYRRGYTGDLADHLEESGFQPGLEVLDVGCGTGISTAFMLERGCRMTGVDVSEAMLARARERVKEATFVQGAAEALPFEARSFDGVVCAQAFHLFDAGKAFGEILRVLRPGGRAATWWKVFAADEIVRDLRLAAYEEFGAKAAGPPLEAAFSSFYAAPFADRRLRVIPMTSRMTVADAVGQERTRVRARASLGEKMEPFLAVYERKLSEHFGGTDAQFLMKYVIYLYVGFIAGAKIANKQVTQYMNFR